MATRFPSDKATLVTAAGTVEEARLPRTYRQRLARLDRRYA